MGPNSWHCLKCSDDMWTLHSLTYLEYSHKEWHNSSGVDSNYSCQPEVPLFFEDMVPLQK